MNEELIELDGQVTPSKTYRINNGRVAGWIDGQNAMIQAIDKILQTERGAWEIYGDDYGHELNTLIGESRDLVNAEIERLLTEALLSDERIISVEGVKLYDFIDDRASLFCEVTTIFGTLTRESEVQL